ncbi:hypothetical protein GE09DRAFT_1050115 [Coniochaeta sp. 2T2.1]|nr:hypothetical protein GE09DRAFT_1050115 [Coniochaeta sp. 2T2.1]
MADPARNGPGHDQPGEPEISSAGAQPAPPQTPVMGDQQVDNDLPTKASPPASSLNVGANQEMGQDSTSALLLAQAPISPVLRSASEHQDQRRCPYTSTTQLDNQLEQQADQGLATTTSTPASSLHGKPNRE